MVAVRKRCFHLPTASFLCCLILCLAPCRWQVLALPDGAPDMVCNSMLPSHNDIPPSDAVPPYQVLTSVSALDPTSGQPLFVRIVGQPEGVKFGGFMLQARNRQRPDEVVGQFRPSENGRTKLINCFDGQENTATHISPSNKLEVTLEWLPPKEFEGEVIFNATVAQTFQIFWVGMSSLPVRIARGVVSNSTLNFDPSGPFLPQMTTKRVPYEPEFMAAALPSPDNLYDGCSVTKTCFGMESDCIQSKDCSSMVALYYKDKKYEFELFSQKAGVRYVSIGLSDDTKMGDDLVTACSVIKGKVQLYTFSTMGGPNYGASRVGVPQDHATLMESTYKNGKIFCKFSREEQTTIGDIDYHLSRDKYHLLLASGSSTDDNGIGYHDLGREASSIEVYLAEIATINPKSRVLVQLHGIFMIMAWIGATSAGVVLARYFKYTWVDKTLWGKERWFSWHRICMSVTISLTMLGFVMIFIEINGWSKDGSPHAILGVVTTILCFVQSIGAVFRPPPGAKKRPFFNWGHWFGGNLAHVLGITAIFFSVRLKKAQLPIWTDWVLVTYVIFYCLIHLIFSCASCLSDRQIAEQRNTLQLNDVIDRTEPTYRSSKTEAPFSGLRQVLLIIYCIGLGLVVLTLIVIIAQSPIK